MGVRFFEGQGSGVFDLPAPGVRGSGDGGLWNLGKVGYSWAATVNDTRGMYLGFHVTYLAPSTADHRACGLPLRCLSE